MKITEKIIKAISSTQEFERIDEYCKAHNANFSMKSVNHAGIEVEKNGTRVFLEVSSVYTEGNGKKTEALEQFQFKVGLVTPKGYFSAKKLPVQIINEEDLLESELEALMEYFHDTTKENTFDPFWYENMMHRNNAAGWIAVAKSLQDDCR
jgi:hypothetical protein